MDLYGLIGNPLTHSFSKRYFEEKFKRENITGISYDLFPLASIDAFEPLLEQYPLLRGLNVTIPYKQEVIGRLDSLDEKSASRIGAVNTIKIFADGSTKGFNTDYHGFRQSLEEWFDRRGETFQGIQSLVLGNGGAAKAVLAALEDLDAHPQLVSRQKAPGVLTYDELTPKVIAEHRLIINTTPLGMYPEIETYPPIPYEALTRDHFLYDLVYNPLSTIFMQKGAMQKAAVQNGLKMLQLQAEKAWDIWTTDGDYWNR